MDGTRNAKLVMQFTDGNVSKIKTSTLFPASWTDAQTTSAVRATGNRPALATRSDGASLHQTTVNGVKVEVIKVGIALLLAILVVGAARTQRNFDR